MRLVDRLLVMHKHERSLRQVVEVVELAAKGLYRSRIPQMAASLAYRTIFAMIPVLVVALVVLRVFTPQDKLASLTERTLDHIGLSRIAVEEAPDFVGPPLPPELRAQGARVDTLVEGLVNRVSSISVTAIGSVGLGLLIYSALSMLVELEQAFNEIYGAPTGRSWTRRIVQYWTTLTLGVLMLGATFLDTSGWLGGLTGGGAGAAPSVAGIVGFLISVGISTLALLFLYVTIPNTRVNIHHAAAGALVAAVVWEAGKWGFAKYIKYSTGYEKLYGSLALIPLFLFWIYITWLIVLFGLQVSYGLQTFRDWKRRQGRQATQQLVIEPAAIVPVLVAVARRFRKGRTADADDVASQTGLSATIALKMLDLLAGAGFVHRMSGSTATVAGERGRAAEPVGECFTLARPADQIAVADVLALGQQMVPPREEGRTGEVMAMLRRAQRAAADSFNIAELAADEAEKPDPAPAGAHAR